MDNATSNCSFVTVKGEKTVVIMYAVFAAIAFLFQATTIIIIAKTKTYNLFLHRLTLYLTIGGMLRTTAYILQVVAVNIDLPDSHPVTLRKGWERVCVLGAFMIHYSPYLQTFTVLHSGLGPGHHARKGFLILSGQTIVLHPKVSQY